MAYGNEAEVEKKRTIIERFRASYAGKFIAASTFRRRQQEKHARDIEQEAS